MSFHSFETVVVPVASESDAESTCRAVLPYLRDGETETLAVYVIEKAGGAPDKASVEQREEYAERVFSIVTEAFDDADAPVRTEVLYGRDVAEAIIDRAETADASAIVFTPRGASRWLKLFTADVSGSLIAKSRLPVIVLPEGDADG